MIRAKDDCFLECMNQVEEVVQRMGSGFVSLHMNGTFLFPGQVIYLVCYKNLLNSTGNK